MARSERWLLRDRTVKSREIHQGEKHFELFASIFDRPKRRIEEKRV